MDVIVAAAVVVWAVAVLAAVVAVAVGAVVPPVAGKGDTMKNAFKKLTGYAALEGQWLRRRHFDEELLAHVAERIKASENTHTGELVLAIEAVMPAHEPDPSMRALEVYGRLRIWDTPLNSGVLLYIALDQRAIEIIADRGITAANTQWQQVCEGLQTHFAQGEYIEGLFAAVDKIEQILQKHAPVGDTSVDILPNEPVII